MGRITYSDEGVTLDGRPVEVGDVLEVLLGGAWPRGRVVALETGGLGLRLDFDESPAFVKLGLGLNINVRWPPAASTAIEVIDGALALFRVGEIALSAGMRRLTAEGQVGEAFASGAAARWAAEFRGIGTVAASSARVFEGPIGREAAG